MLGTAMSPSKHMGFGHFQAGVSRAEQGAAARPYPLATLRPCDRARRARERLLSDLQKDYLKCITWVRRRSPHDPGGQVGQSP